jgi:hypothetical protein
VLEAGNAAESYLVELAVPAHINPVGANGLNAKLDRFDNAHWIPKKLIFVGKHLGHDRNAADHGFDADINAAWTIRAATGLEYVFLTCSSIPPIIAKEVGAAEI